MRRLWAIAVSLLLAASMPVLAQRGGGGHASAGGHGGFSGGHAGGFSGGHSFGGFHSGSSFAPRSYSRSFSRGPIASRGFNRGVNRGFNRGTNFRIRTYGFGNNCYGYRCGYGSGWGYPYLYGGIDSYWWWDNDSDNGYDPGQPYNYDNGLANQMQQQGIPLRPPDPEDQNYSARSMPQHHEERTEASTPTVLVFRDQHTQDVQNYAIVGETLWTFAPQKTQKIPLDDLDLPATRKVNDERGVTFRIPNAGEGQ
jgi:hypothetical protein